MKRPIVIFYGVALPTILISILGLVMVFSASSVKALQESGSSVAIVGRQAILFTVGVLISLFLFRAPFAFLKRISSLSLLLSITALALPQIPGIGKEVNGNTNWISLGGFTMQPSEFAKLGMILWIAGVLARHESRVVDGVQDSNDAGRRLATELLPGIIAMMALILLGRDLGTALVFAAIAAAMLFVAGVQLRWFIVAIAALAVMATVLILTQSNRIYRIKALLGSRSLRSIIRMRDGNQRTRSWGLLRVEYSALGLVRESRSGETSLRPIPISSSQWSVRRWDSSAH